MPQQTDPRRRTRVGSDSLPEPPFASKRLKIDLSSLASSGSTTSNTSASSGANLVKRPEMSTVGSITTGGGSGAMAQKVPAAPPPPLQVPFRGTRVLVIKNQRPHEDRKAKLVEHHKKALAEALVAVDAMLAGAQPGIAYERLYRSIEDMCRFGLQEEIAQALNKRLKEYVYGHVKPKLVILLDAEFALLRGTVGVYGTWIKNTALLRSTFSFLEQTYLVQKQSRLIPDIATKIFREMLFPSSKSKADASSLGSRVVLAVCELVRLDRARNSDFDLDLLRDSIGMLHNLRSYHHFEAIFMELSNQFYESFAASSTSEQGLQEYIHGCQDLINREDDRCTLCNFDSTTRRFVSDSTQKLLISDYSQKLLHEGSVSRLITDNQVDSLRVLVHMLRDAGLQDKLIDPWQDYITKTGRQIMDETKDTDMIVGLIRLKAKMEAMARDAFRDNPKFGAAIRTKLGLLFQPQDQQSKGNRPNMGEVLAKYMDMLLRGDLRQIPADLLDHRQPNTGDEEQLDRQLNYALDLFRLIDGKGVFEGFYKRHLSRRLLMGRSANLELERAMVAKLTDMCGGEFTSNLERMFKDLDRTPNFMNAFHDECAFMGVAPSTDFDFKVLSISAWPTYPILKVNLPHEVASHVELFDKSYTTRHTGRVLKWPLGLATCVVSAVFDKGTKDLCVSAAQAAVLMAFNQVESAEPGRDFLSYPQLQQVTNLEDAELQRTLQSLACAKTTRVLIKHPRGREINKSDTFTVNKAFTHPSTRVKINQVQMRDTATEVKETRERVQLDRVMEIQAAIIRLMKSRQTMTHAELIEGAMAMLQKRGSVSPAEFKGHIEKLIEKEYIERVEPSSYCYLA